MEIEHLYTEEKSKQTSVIDGQSFINPGGVLVVVRGYHKCFKGELQEYKTQMKGRQRDGKLWGRKRENKRDRYR